MKPKRVLIFSIVYLPRYIGGAEIAVKEITDRNTDIEFEMLTLRTEKKRIEKIGNITVRRIGIPWYGKGNSIVFFVFKYLYMPWALLVALWLHMKNPYDAIWTIMAGYASGPALFFKWLHPKIPFLITLQEGDPFAHIRKRVGITYPIFKKLFSKADHIQAISKYLADWAIVMGYQKIVSIIPNGVDIKSFSLTEAEKEKHRSEIRSRFNILPKDTILVTTSRLVVKNGIDRVIEALSKLPENTKFMVVGDGELKDELQTLAADLGVADRIIWVGQVSSEEIPSYLAVGDIFIRLSRSEGLGNSFIEAMAAGLPVIATPVGGIPEFITNKVNGILVSEDNTDELVLRIKELVEDSGYMQSLKNAGRETAEKYSWNISARRMQNEVFADLFKKE